MPIVVDEVVISVDVGGAEAPAAEGAAATAQPNGRPASSGDQQAMIQECVERVLEVLSRREER
jgi:hypothetical protein